MDKPTCSDEDLNGLQWSSILYYIRELNDRTGLIADRTQPGSPASIAAVGMAVATIPVLLERYHLPRHCMAKSVLQRLRFLWNSPQGPEPDATGYKGFYYHFLDMETGRRAGHMRAIHRRFGVPPGWDTDRRELLRSVTPKRNTRFAASPTRSTGAWTGVGR